VKTNGETGSLSHSPASDWELFMSKNRPFSLASRLASFIHAGRGLKFVLQNEHNAWIHAILTVVVIVLAIVLKISATEWCFLILAMSVVWITETLNTAIERLTDLVSPEHHPLAGKVKDIAAGAVLLAAIAAVIIGAIIFIPHL